MRTFIFLVWIVLVLIAVAGMGLAVFLIVKAATDHGPERADGIAAAILVGLYPFALGTLALGGAGIMSLLEMQVEQTEFLRSSVLDYVRRIETAARGRVGDVAQKEDSRGNQGSRAET